MKKNILVILIMIMLVNIFQVNINAVDFNDIQIESQDYLLINLDNQEVLLENNSQKKIFPASITKVMTAILIIENTTNFDKKIVFTEAEEQLHTVYGAQTLGFGPGEVITVDDALYTMLMASCADSAHAAAVHMAGSENEFVKLMNAKAKKLGMKNTHFMNSTGLHDENHYTTLEDLSILFQYCMKNQKFAEIMKTQAYVLDETYHDEYLINSLHQILFNQHGFDSRYITAAKTGFTDVSGDSVISICEKDGMSFMFLVAEGYSLNDLYRASINDSAYIYNYLFNQYHSIKIDDELLEEETYVTVPKDVTAQEIEVQKDNDSVILLYENEVIKKIELNEKNEFFSLFIKILLFIGIVILAYWAISGKEKNYDIKR